MFILSQKFEIEMVEWWIAPWKGDPGRTLVYANAKRYKTERGAKIARTYYMERYSHIRKISLKIEWVEK